MKRTFTNIFTGLIAVLAIFAATDSVQAQRVARGRVYTKAQVGRIIKNVETGVDKFKEQYDKSLDRSRLNGTKREDALNQRAKELESATDELRREFDRRDTWQENRDEVRRCLDAAADINANLRRQRYARGVETNWRSVVRELNTLGQVYNLPGIGSGAYR